MPRSNGFHYIIHGHCSLFSYPEWYMLWHKNSCTLGSFVFEDILYYWGEVKEIVTDNGPAFVQAVEYLLKQYHINHIYISLYNSCANSPVKWCHFNVQESLIKAGNGKESLWTMVAPFVFWAEWVSIQKFTGYSPYFLAHGTEPLFPFNLFEATYLALSYLSYWSHCILCKTTAKVLRRPCWGKIKTAEGTLGVSSLFWRSL